MLVPLSRKGGRDAENTVEIADARYPADGAAERSLQQESIQKALNAIPAKYREVVVLCDVQELSYDEISAVTGLNVGTVKSRLNRGRAQLQKLLKDLIHENE